MSAASVPESALPDNLKKLWLKAISAVEMNNHGYAINLLQSILKEEPAFLEGRKVARACGIKIARDAGPKKGLTMSQGTMGLKGKMKKDPRATIIEIEKRLESEPTNVDLNECLFEAANLAGLHETAAFALTTIRENHEGNAKSLHKLAEHYLLQGQTEKAAEVYNEIVKRDPSDGAASKKGRDASAMASMKQGGWDSTGDFRSKMKNASEAAEIEQASRSGMTREQIDAQIVVLGAKYAEDPNNLDIVRRIADLYERKEDWENAYSYFHWAFTLSKSDSALQNKAESMADKLRQHQIKTLEAEVAQGGPEADEKKAILDQMKGQAIDERIQEARARVERNPTDQMLRFDLGEYLYDGGFYTEAIPELQRAKSNPSIRLRAMLLLGKCCDAKKMFDLAASHFKEAIAELTMMDNIKKDALYSLGIVYEHMNNKEQSIECMKEIYNADYEYRDVAHRVESSYADA
jgi:tetratricopeptide (TPR) repeat protein